MSKRIIERIEAHANLGHIQTFHNVYSIFDGNQRFTCNPCGWDTYLSKKTVRQILGNK